jgi:PAS domain S-box-containing protein
LKCFGGLRAKLIGYTLVTIVLCLSSFFFVIVFMNRAQMMRRFERKAVQMGALIEVGLEHGMQHGNQKVTLQMLHSLAKQPDLKGIYILNKKGDLKIFSNEASIGQHLDIQDRTCQLCHSVTPDLKSKSGTFNIGTERVFRSVTPIINKKECHSCHKPGQKLNGILIVDYSMQPFHAEFRRSFMKTFVAVLLTIVGVAISIWILFSQLIMRRLLRLLKSVRQVSAGDLSSHITIAEEDEISELERSFNEMSGALQKSIGEVEQARDSLARLINSIEDEIIVIDKNFFVISLNHGALSRLGLQKDQVIGHRCHEVYYHQPQPCSNSERDCPVRETVITGLSYSTCHSFVVEGEIRHFDQRTSPMQNCKGEIEQVIKISRDVTHRRKLEDQLVQSERLIALGQLAAGVAHQVNNPVGVIVNRIDCLKREGKVNELPESLKADLDVIMECAWRVNAIARSLLTFSREAPLLLEPVDVNLALGTAVDLVQMQTAKKKVTIEKNLQPDLPLVRGNLNKLEQCLVNILNNAIDAISDEGMVKVESMLDSRNGQWNIIRISDSGDGIAPEDLPKIFDPFFTTKAVGKGTGLGLSISYGIVKEHQGRLEVSSSLGGGATFTISLPVLDGQQEK